MAKTVGSVMSNHVGKGRYLTDEYLCKEVYLGEFTLRLRPKF